MKKTIEVLQILAGGKTFNGITSYLYQQYRAIDKEIIHYDFLYTKRDSFKMVKDDPVFKNSEFYSIGYKENSSMLKYYINVTRQLKRLLSQKHYDFVVVNSSVVELLYACYLAVAGHKDTHFVAHAHNAGLFIKKGALRKRLAFVFKVMESYFQSVLRKKATYLFTCSDEATEFTFGEEALQNDKLIMINNAIDIKHYAFDMNKRQTMRSQTGIDDNALVIGFVGSLLPNKNVAFLMDVFSEVRKMRAGSKLWLVGAGEEMEKLKRHAEQLGIMEDAVFWGQRSDVADVMQGMDVFVLPSITEGLGMVAIEAQASGLPTIVSSGVPDGALVTKLAKKNSLKQTPQEWACQILAHYDGHPCHEDVSEELVRAGFDIAHATKKVESYYQRLYR